MTMTTTMMTTRIIDDDDDDYNVAWNKFVLIHINIEHDTSYILYIL